VTPLGLRRVRVVLALPLLSLPVGFPWRREVDARGVKGAACSAVPCRTRSSFTPGGCDGSHVWVLALDHFFDHLGGRACITRRGVEHTPDVAADANGRVR